MAWPEIEATRVAFARLPVIFQTMERSTRPPSSGKPVEQDAFQRRVGPAQRQQQQVTDSADEQAGERTDDGHLELYPRTRWLLLDIGDAAEDEQGNVFHGQTAPVCHE